MGGPEGAILFCNALSQEGASHLPHTSRGLPGNLLVSKSLHPAFALTVRSGCSPECLIENASIPGRMSPPRVRIPAEAGFPILHPPTSIFVGCGAAVRGRCQVFKALSESRAGVPPAIGASCSQTVHHGPAIRRACGGAFLDGYGPIADAASPERQPRPTTSMMQSGVMSKDGLGFV